MDGRPDRDLPLDHLSPRRSLGLIADKDDIVCRIAQPLFQVIDNPSAGTHAATGYNDGRAGDAEQFLMVLIFSHGIKTLEVQRMVAPLADRSLASWSQ